MLYPYPSITFQISYFRKMNVLLAIPARYGSSRFEGKPLTNIHGKTMIQRVVEQCQKVQAITAHQITVVVATDDQRIFEHASNYTRTLMTSSNHESGTDRVAEVVTQLTPTFDVVINVQGDEPLIHPEQIVQLIDCFANPDTQIATLIKPEEYHAGLDSPNAVKCVVNTSFKAIYFSRYLIPFHRNEAVPTGKEFYRHIGMYGFKPEILKALTQLPMSTLEKAECLEQLRWIENGYEIQTALTHFENISVDSPEDLERVLARL